MQVMPEKKVSTKRSSSKPRAKAQSKAAVPVLVPQIADNEKAILIGLAYLVGFLTAYIAFALNVEKHQYVTTTIEPVDTRVVGAYQASLPTAVKAITNDEGLFVSRDGHDRIISAQTDNAEAELGFHHRVVTALVAPKGDFVYYAVVMGNGEATVAHFVYSVANDTVYRVTDGTGPFSATEDAALGASWSADGMLQLGGRTSASNSEPWVLK